MEVIAPVHHALLACGSWRLASLPPFACRQTGFNGKLDSMANWIQWQTGVQSGHPTIFGSPFLMWQ